MTKRNIQQDVRDPTQRGNSTMSNLLGIRQAAAKDRRLQFTALFHHITPYSVERLFLSIETEVGSGGRWCYMANLSAGFG